MEKSLFRHNHTPEPNDKIEKRISSFQDSAHQESETDQVCLLTQFKNPDCVIKSGVGRAHHKRLKAEK